jgi:hypothetical protein
VITADKSSRRFGEAVMGTSSASVAFQNASPGRTIHDRPGAEGRAIAFSDVEMA